MTFLVAMFLFLSWLRIVRIGFQRNPNLEYATCLFFWSTFWIFLGMQHCQHIALCFCSSGLSCLTSASVTLPSPDSDRDHDVESSCSWSGCIGNPDLFRSRTQSCRMGLDNGCAYKCWLHLWAGYYHWCLWWFNCGQLHLHCGARFRPSICNAQILMEDHRTLFPWRAHASTVKLLLQNTTKLPTLSHGLRFPLARPPVHPQVARWWDVLWQRLWQGWQCKKLESSLLLACLVFRSAQCAVQSIWRLMASCSPKLLNSLQIFANAYSRQYASIPDLRPFSIFLVGPGHTMGFRGISWATLHLQSKTWASKMDKRITLKFKGSDFVSWVVQWKPFCCSFFSGKNLLRLASTSLTTQWTMPILPRSSGKSWGQWGCLLWCVDVWWNWGPQFPIFLCSSQ